jgi:hypothetical protein
MKLSLVSKSIAKIETNRSYILKNWRYINLICLALKQICQRPNTYCWHDVTGSMQEEKHCRKSESLQHPNLADEHDVGVFRNWLGGRPVPVGDHPTKNWTLQRNSFVHNDGLWNARFYTAVAWHETFVRHALHGLHTMIKASYEFTAAASVSKLADIAEV